jgi:hypothetical protein
MNFEAARSHLHLASLHMQKVREICADPNKVAAPFFV